MFKMDSLLETSHENEKSKSSDKKTKPEETDCAVEDFIEEDEPLAVQEPIYKDRSKEV